MDSHMGTLHVGQCLEIKPYEPLETPTDYVEFDSESSKMQFEEDTVQNCLERTTKPGNFLKGSLKSRINELVQTGEANFNQVVGGHIVNCNRPLLHVAEKFKQTIKTQSMSKGRCRPGDSTPGTNLLG